MPDELKSKISELEKGLYGKDFTTHRVEDVVPRKAASSAPTWVNEQADSSIRGEDQENIKRHTHMKKFFLFSSAIFVLALLVAGGVWLGGGNIVSGDNIVIGISAPVAVAGGEVLDSTIKITNNNKVAIKEGRLLIEYPAGFYTTPDNTELTRTIKQISRINPGASVVEKTQTVLYGEQNTSKEIRVTLEYSMDNSNAVIKKNKSYLVKVSSSPINIKIDIPREVSGGQEMNMAIEVKSNSNDTIRGLVLEAVYPPGFIFQSGNPAPTYGTNVWKILGLSPNEKRTIKINGILEGQESEEKVTKISIGTESQSDERSIGVVYNAATETTSITKPFLALETAVNNNKAQDAVAPLNRGVRVDIFWQNNSPTKLSDVVLEIKLKGTALDKYSLYASGGGFYRSIDNTIVWDKMVAPDLAVVDPGARGVVSFSFSPVALGVDSGRLIKNPQIIYEVRARATRMSDVSAVESVATFISRSIKFETDLRLTALGTHFVGPFQNTGPIPPKADKETTYTVSLVARSSANNVSNVSVKTTLPIYVKWLGRISPEGEAVTFDQATGEVLWNVGRIPAGGSRDVALQVSFLPSISQIRLTPPITGEFTLVGTDDFTKSDIKDKKQPVSTFLPSDPQFGSNDANVVQ